MRWSVHTRILCRILGLAPWDYVKVSVLLGPRPILTRRAPLVIGAASDLTWLSPSWSPSGRR